MEQGYNLRGASAIIEKDLATGLLAKEIDADVMMIQGQFEFASMLPKISASIDFLENGKGRQAIITTLDRAKDSLKGNGGTIIE